MINFRINSQDLERAKKMLSGIPGAYSRAVNAALGRTLSQMKTQAVRLTAQKYYLKSGDISKTITTSRSGMSATLRSRGSKKSIADYFISPKVPRKGMKGIQAAVRKDGIKHLNAFLIRLGGAGKYYPYVRVGKGRWDIKRVMSPAVPQAIGNEEVMSELEEFTGEKFSERLNHEVMRALGVYAK